MEEILTDPAEAPASPGIPLQPDDVILYEAPDGGRLITNLGRLVWQSPAGSRYVIAGA